MFFPNKCGVCDETKVLKKCSRCNLISYCGQDHQKQHLKEHKKLCKLIAEIMKEEGVSHIFERSRGAGQIKWIQDRKAAIQKVKQRLGRDLEPDEEAMFHFPRNCFICHETRSTDLSNCTRCPFASFCKHHRGILRHGKNCMAIKYCYLIGIYNSVFGPDCDNDAIISLVRTELNKSLNPPISMRDFVDNHIENLTDIDETLKMIVSEYFSVPLTLYNALKLLNFSHTYSLIFHVGVVEIPVELVHIWEVILHFLPNLKKLKVVYFDQKIDSSRVDLPVCEHCSLKQKTLAVYAIKMSYNQFSKSKLYEKPDLVAFLNVDVPSEDDLQREEYESKILTSWGQIPFCLVISATLEKKKQLIEKDLQSVLCHREIFGDIINEFASLKPQMEWEEGGVFMSHQFMFICNPLTRKFFYANICHVCGSNYNYVPCKGCKMIFYCREEHERKHRITHKDLCEVLAKMREESGAKSLFEHLKGADSETWMQGRIELMVHAEIKLGRKLLDYEEQIFFFPRACLICHESDIDLLCDCECGVNLCQEHKSDPKHAELCSDLSLAFELTRTKQLPIMLSIVKDVKIGENEKLPSSIKIFIDLYLKLNYGLLNVNVPDFEKLMISEFLTRPLTLLYALQRLNVEIKSTMVIHVIGASTFEIWSQKYWKILLFWLRSLKKLTVVFIGPDYLEFSVDEAQLTFSESSLEDDQTLSVGTPPIRYEDYFQHQSFSQPNIIVGYNLEIHETEFGITVTQWKNMVLAVEQVGVPFILTAGTEERAKKDHKTLCTLLENSVDYFCSELNPYAGLIPERDLETDGLRYPNQWITIYDKLHDGLR